MTTIVDLRTIKTAATTPTPLDLLVARLAREHDGHETGVLPCYLCLHGVARRTAALRKAA